MTDIRLFLAGVYIGGAVCAAMIAYASQLDEEGETVMGLAMIFLWPILMSYIVLLDTWEHYQKIKKGDHDV